MIPFFKTLIEELQVVTGLITLAQGPVDLASNLIQLKDIFYEIIPGFLPATAIHEILSEHEGNRDSLFQQTVGEFREIRCALPEEWKLSIAQMQELQPSFITPSIRQWI